ncbi:MAG TPA: glycosyltransferase family 2 protein [Verrucomicrobiae bacterium]|nr:glycosyltransferase family 2 protein [Verrucomicrobiae bacterium]
MRTDVTVIMPAHNAEQWIGPAIASVLAQTYEAWELWVLENGSTDRTLEVARRFEGSRIRVFDLGPVGFQGALQFGIESAGSEWLARMDADDIMLPERLQVQMDFIAEHPEIALVSSGFGMMTPFGHIFERLPAIETREVDRAFLGIGRRRFGDPCTVFSRRAALEAGGLDPEFSMGDVPLWFRILERGKGWQLGRPLYVYRLSPRSMSKNAAFIKECMRARQKYAPEIMSAAFPSEVRPGSFWGFIVLLEMLAGDTDCLRQAILELEREGDFSEEAQRMRRLSRGGRLVSTAYRYRYRRRYRRRTDWEKAMAHFLNRSAIFEERGMVEEGIGEKKAYA